MIKLISTTADAHKPFTGVREISFTLDDDVSVDELVDSFQAFMYAVGYSTDIKLDYTYDLSDQQPNYGDDLDDRNREQDNDQEEVLRGC